MEAAKISVQNLSTVMGDAHVEALVKALNAQCTEQYNSSAWVTEGLAAPCAGLTLIERGVAIPSDTWHLEVLDTSDQEGALGYHEEGAFDVFDNTVCDNCHEAGEPTAHPRKASPYSARGLRADAPKLPLMKVFAKTTLADREWPSEVCSHEMLEALVDPRPMQTPYEVRDTESGRIYIVEVGDPVQQSGSTIDGFLVANFCLPAYFKLGTASSQYDYGSVLKAPVPAMTPGGYMSYAEIASPESWHQIFGSAS